MIQQQKRIEVIQRMRADAAFEPNAGAFDDRLRLDDFCEIFLDVSRPLFYLLILFAVPIFSITLDGLALLSFLQTARPSHQVGQ